MKACLRNHNPDPLFLHVSLHLDPRKIRGKGKICNTEAKQTYTFLNLLNLEECNSAEDGHCWSLQEDNERDTYLVLL